MRRAKVIDRADHAHALVQRQGVARQGPAPARQRREVFPECCVQPFAGRGVAHPVPLRAASERLYACRCAIHNTAFGLDHTPPLVVFDDLGDTDMAPWTEPWPSTRARMHGIAKGFPNRSYWIPGSYAPALSEKGNSFLRLLKNKGFREESMTKVGVDAIGTSTTLESNKSLYFLAARGIGQGKAVGAQGNTHHTR